MRRYKRDMDPLKDILNPWRSDARIGRSAKAIHGFQRWHDSALRRVSDHARELEALDATIGRATEFAMELLTSDFEADIEG